MKKIRFVFKIIFFVVLSVPSLASDTDALVNTRITELLRPNWPYEAFLAIPRIAELRPTLAIALSKQDGSLEKTNCIEIFYLELQKEFEPKAVLERESLHKLLCRAMQRAVNKTPISQIHKTFPGTDNITLKFDFSTGFIKVTEIPYPPLDPLLRLENVFLDETDVLVFGDIELPEELKSEISQSPL